MEARYNRKKSQEVLKSRIHPLNSWFYTFPAHARRRIEYSFRTTVTTLVCMVLTYQFGWTPFAAFLSPSNSIASSSLHIGVWQSDMFKAVVASMIGSVVGVVIGFAHSQVALQLILLFFGLAWLNKCSALDRGQAAYAGQAVLLCGSLVQSQYSVFYVVYSSLMVLMVPYLITGFTLLLVFPASAVFTARAKVIIICRKFSLMLSAMIKSFHTTEYVNLYCAEFEQLQSELESDLVELKSLADTVNNEKIIFPNIIHLPNALVKLHEILDKMLLDLAGLKDAARSIHVNHTNEMFVESLSEALEDLDLETEIAFCIVGEYFDSFEIISSQSYQWTFDYMTPVLRLYEYCAQLWCGCCTRKNPQGDEDELLDYEDCFDEPRGSVKSSSSESAHSIKNREHRGTSSAYNTNIKQMYGVPSSLDLMKSLNEKRRSMGYQEHENDDDDSGAGQLGDYRLSGAGTVSPPGTVASGLHRKSGSTTDSKGSKTPVKDLDKKNDKKKKDKKERVVDIELSPVRSEGVASGSESSTERVAPKTPNSKKQEDPEKTDSRNEVLRADFSDCVIQLFASRTQLITAYGKTRNNYTALTAGDSVVQPLRHPPTGNKVPFDSNSEGSFSSKSVVLESVKTKISVEHFRLGSKNLNPRDVYLHRLSVIIESVVSMQDAFELMGKPWSPITFLTGCYTAVLTYFYTCATAVQEDVHLILAVFKKSERSTIYQCQDLIELLWSWFKLYVNAVKLAMAVVIASSLVLYDLSPQFSLTSAFVIVFIRTEYSSSSFLKSYQRVEGTVVGAVYAFGCLQIFNCSNSQCGPVTMIPLLIFWLALCMLFVEGQRHGYAAYVASYTPMILMIGNTAGTSVAWTRIEQTFIGVAIYLLIDNLVLPVRTYSIVKESVLQCITATRVMYCDSVFAIDDLINLERLVAEENDGDAPVDDYTTVKKRSNSIVKIEGEGTAGSAAGGGSVVTPALKKMVIAAGASGGMTTTSPTPGAASGANAGAHAAPPTPAPPTRHRTDSISTVHSIASKLSANSNFMYRSAGLEDIKEIVEKRRQNSVVTSRTLAGITIERNRGMSVINILSGDDQPLLSRQHSYSINSSKGSIRRPRRPSAAGSTSSPASPVRSALPAEPAASDASGTGAAVAKKLSPVIEDETNRDSDRQESEENPDAPPSLTRTNSSSSTPRLLVASRSFEFSPDPFYDSRDENIPQPSVRGPLATVPEGSTDDSDEATSRNASKKPLRITPPWSDTAWGFEDSIQKSPGSPREKESLTTSMKFTEAFIQCNVHLADAEEQLKLVNAQLSKQTELLDLVIHEPELCYKKFPMCEYEKLLHKFKKVTKSGRSVNEGCQQFSIVLVQMIDKQENVSLHLNLFAFMSNQLFLITEKVDDALSWAFDALERVYYHNDFDADLSAISVLSHYTETLLAAVDEHFRQNFLKQAGELLDMQLNPYFLLAWVNVFESMRYLMQHLSELGMALHSIKNVEALMTV